MVNGMDINQPLPPKPNAARLITATETFQHAVESELQDSINTFNASLVALTQQFETLRPSLDPQIATFFAESIAAVSSVTAETLKRNKEGLDTLRAKLTTAIQQLKNHTDTYQTAVNDYDKVKSELQKQLEIVRLTKSSLEQRGDALAAKEQELQQGLSTLATTCSKFDTAKTAWGEARALLENQVEELREQVENATIKASQLQGYVDQFKAGGSSTATELALARSEGYSAGLRDAEDNAKSQQDMTNKAVRMYSQELLFDINQVHANMRTVAEENETFKAEKVQIARELKSAKDRIEKLKNEKVYTAAKFQRDLVFQLEDSKTAQSKAVASNFATYLKDQLDSFGTLQQDFENMITDSTKACTDRVDKAIKAATNHQTITWEKALGGYNDLLEKDSKRFTQNADYIEEIQKAIVTFANSISENCEAMKSIWEAFVELRNATKKDNRELK